MNRVLRNAAIIGVGASILTSAASLPANAYYLGYGNGDPGNWDFWTEQHGGPKHSVLAPAKPTRHVVAHHHHPQKQKSSDQTHS